MRNTRRKASRRSRSARAATLATASDRLRRGNRRTCKPPVRDRRCQNCSATKSDGAGYRLIYPRNSIACNHDVIAATIKTNSLIRTRHHQRTRTPQAFVVCRRHREHVLACDVHHVHLAVVGKPKPVSTGRQRLSIYLDRCIRDKEALVPRADLGRVAGSVNQSDNHKAFRPELCRGGVAYLGGSALALEIKTGRH